MNFTNVAPVKLVPVIVTGVPTTPLVGLKLEIVGAGAGFTVNEVAEVTVPPGAVTEIVPELAPVGTEVLMCWSSVTVNVAVVPPNLTNDAPVKPLPMIVTGVPMTPLVGLKLPIVGAGAAPSLKVAIVPVQATELELNVAEYPCAPVAVRSCHAACSPAPLLLTLNSCAGTTGV